MENQTIQKQTKNCPGIYYEKGADTLFIKGRSIPENPESIFKPLRDWVATFFASSEALKMSIILEYINSGSSKHLIEMLKTLKQYQEEGKHLDITWYYEEDDEAILELGEHFRDTSGLAINIEMLLDQEEGKGHRAWGRGLVYQREVFNALPGST